MSTENIYAAVLRLADAHHQRKPLRQHLDVGAGYGNLIKLFQERFQTEASACDYTDELMKLPGMKVSVANLNSEGLPYPDNSFDVVTATEVVEHLEHYRETLREFYRVLRPGGVCILSTPNVLNMNSRLHYLWFGFPNLFGPLKVKHSELYTTGGHINPVTSFHLCHSLLDANFESIRYESDKYQRNSIAKTIPLWPFLKLFSAMAWRMEVRRETIDAANAPLVKEMNSWRMLVSRTLVLSVVKPG